MGYGHSTEAFSLGHLPSAIPANSWLCLNHRAVLVLLCSAPASSFLGQPRLPRSLLPALVRPSLGRLELVQGWVAEAGSGHCTPASIDSTAVGVLLFSTPGLHVSWGQLFLL